MQADILKVSGPYYNSAVLLALVRWSPPDRHCRECVMNPLKPCVRIDIQHCFAWNPDRYDDIKNVNK
jgi:hypothetical protein